MPQYAVACNSVALISSTVTPLVSAPLTCSLISGARFSAVSIARFSRLRVLRSSVGSPQAQPQAMVVVARWKAIMKSSALAIDASTYSAPSTSRRIGRPLSNRALSSDMVFLLVQGREARAGRACGQPGEPARRRAVEAPPPETAPVPPAYRIAHLSDLHFGAELPDVVAALAEELARDPPDLVAISGDLTMRGRTREFIAAKAFIDGLRSPVLAVPGNHDLVAYWLAERYLDPYARWRRHVAAETEPVFQDAKVGVVGLNTARRGGWYLDWSRGRISRDRLARCEARLA